MMQISWWVWLTFGVLLMISEVLLGSFVVLWFGIGFVLAGGVIWFFPLLNPGWGLLIAALSGTLFLLLLRRHCISGTNATYESLYTFTGGQGTLLVREQDGKLGFSVSCRGTYWRVANPEVIVEAQRVTGHIVTVERVEHNLAYLRQEK